MQHIPHTLISVIVNKGMAEEVMEAARGVGATGGTIIPARGTGKEEDVKFFGYPLVPEKDMLLILAGADQTGRILEAVNNLPILSTPGTGIAFCVDVERFMVFGAPQNSMF
ncbi:MAG: P-II family nitrogen regulator [Sphaerochaeta sp.]